MRAYTVTRFGSCFPSIAGVDDPSCTGEGEYLDSALVSGGEQESTWSPWSCLLREALYMPARSMEWQIIHAVCFDVCFLLSAPLYGQDELSQTCTLSLILGEACATSQSTEKQNTCLYIHYGIASFFQNALFLHSAFLSVVILMSVWCGWWIERVLFYFII
jgi:hypothetical protein